MATHPTVFVGGRGRSPLTALPGLRAPTATLPVRVSAAMAMTTLPVFRGMAVPPTRFPSLPLRRGLLCGGLVVRVGDHDVVGGAADHVLDVAHLARRAAGHGGG